MEKGESGDDGSQQVRLNLATARVPPSVAEGVFGTGAIVMNGAHEFVIDFVQHMGPPPRVVGRVVLPVTVMRQFIGALQQNLAGYEQQFGTPPPLPKTDPAAPRPPIQEVYENLKLPDEMLSGSYANAVLIRHSAAEFSFDFVTSFYPHAAVSTRIFLAAPHVVPLLESLKKNLAQYEQHVSRQARPPQDPPAPPTEGAS